MKRKTQEKLAKAVGATTPGAPPTWVEVREALEKLEVPVVSELRAMRVALEKLAATAMQAAFVYASYQRAPAAKPEGKPTRGERAVTVPETPEPAPKAPETPKGPTMQDVRKALLVYAQEHGLDAARAKLRPFGAERAADLKPEQFAAVLLALQEPGPKPGPEAA